MSKPTFVSNVILEKFRGCSQYTDDNGYIVFVPHKDWITEVIFSRRLADRTMLGDRRYEPTRSSLARITELLKRNKSINVL